MTGSHRLNFTVELDRVLHDRALVVAEDEDRSLANLLRRALRLYIEHAEARLPKPEPLAPPHRWTVWPPDEYDLPDTEDDKQRDADSA